MKSPRVPFLLLSAVAGLLCLLAGTGCSSTGKAGSASFASVIIANHSVAEIEAATAQVFLADGFVGGTRYGQDYVFDKEGSRATTLSREGFIATYDGAQSLNRVRVQIVPLPDGTHRLQCRAYAVKTGADEVPLTNLRSKPYRALLEKVQQQLK